MEQSDSDDEYEPLSYKKLMKFIETNHPRHPETKDNWGICSRITIKRYYWILFDPCFVFTLITGFRKFKKRMVKKCRKWNSLGRDMEEQA